MFRDVASKIGEALHELGVSETAEPNALTEEEIKKLPPVRAYNTDKVMYANLMICISSSGFSLERTVGVGRREHAPLAGSPNTLRKIC